MRFSTRTIHAGQPSEPHTGAVVAPIFQTTTYQQIGPGEHRGFDYTRTSNPTRKRLEAVLADLEGGTHAVPPKKPKVKRSSRVEEESPQMSLFG